MICLAGIAIGCPANSVPRYLVDVERNVVYGVGRVAPAPESKQYEFKDLLLDVYTPIGDNNDMRIALILVHGGSFSTGSKEKEEIVDFARFFAQRGYACFSINYRLTSDNPPAPDGWSTTLTTRTAHAAMVDVKAAVRFVRANAADWNVDPGRILLLGESAGAIASVTTAVTEPDDFNTDGPEFSVPEQNTPGVSPRVQGYIHFWGNADHVLSAVDPGDPPTLIVHGTDDDNIFTPFNSAERFHTLLEFYGIPHDFYQLEDEGHGAWDAIVDLQGLKSLTLEFINERVLDKNVEAGLG